MSRHVSMRLLKNYSNKFHHVNNFQTYSHRLNSSISHISKNYRLFSTSPFPDTIQATNQPQTLVTQPIEETLSYVEKEITAAESVTLLKSLRMLTLFKGINTSTFIRDPRFKDLCDIFEKQCGQLPPSLLVSGLRSLLDVGVPESSSCIVAAEETVLRSIRDFNILNLIGCLYFHHKFNESDLQKEVNLALVDAIQNRADEISNPAEVLMLMHIYHLFQGNHQKVLELQILEIIPIFHTLELCKLFSVMGEKSMRNVFILKVAAFHLRKRASKPDLKETIDVLYVFKKLNFYEPLLYAHLLNDLPLEIPSVKQASQISRLLTLCGHIRWRNTGILNACEEWIKANFDACRTREFVSYILTMATLNYTTPETLTLLERIIPHLTVESINSNAVLLDITWSLAILDCVPKEMLLTVLSSQFYNGFNGESHVTDSSRLKLLNLKGVLRKKYPECIFSCDLYLESFKLSESAAIENCRDHVLKVLSNFVPKDKFLCTKQVSDTGVFIDAELIMGKNMKPLSLLEYGTLAHPESTSKELPKDAKRIALLIRFHKDITHSTYSLTGVNALGTRLLREAGYTVATIPYIEYSENKTELQKTKYLLEEIKNVVTKPL